MNLKISNSNGIWRFRSRYRIPLTRSRSIVFIVVAQNLPAGKRARLERNGKSAQKEKLPTRKFIAPETTDSGEASCTSVDWMDGVGPSVYRLSHLWVPALAWRQKSFQFYSRFRNDEVVLSSNHQWKLSVPRDGKSFIVTAFGRGCASDPVLLLAQIKFHYHKGQLLLPLVIIKRFNYL